MNIKYNESFFRKQLQREMINSAIDVKDIEAICMGIVPIGFYKIMGDGKIFLYIFRRFIKLDIVMKALIELGIKTVITMQEDVKYFIEFSKLYNQTGSQTFTHIGVSFHEYTRR